MRSLCIAFLVALSLGCETRVSLGVPCRNDNECTSGLHCNFGRCRTGCEASSECSMGQYCLTINSTQGACTLPTDTCDEARALGCEEGLTCADHACVSLCATGEACLAGSTCEANVCLPDSLVSDAGMDAAVALDVSQTDASLDASVCEVASTAAERTLCVGEDFACAVFAGEVHCWGYNGNGQLGDGTDTVTPRVHRGGTHDYSGTRVRVLVGDSGDTPLSNASSLACGREGACALADGRLWCWGYINGNARARAFELSPGLVGATELTMGNNHGCVRVGAGYRCWGENHSNVAPYSDAADFRFDGRIGFDPHTDYAPPGVATDFASSTRVEAGSFFTCAARSDGVYCQGWNEDAVCGDDPAFGFHPDAGARDLDTGGLDGGVLPRVFRPVAPTPRQMFLGAVRDMHCGETHACVLSSDGVVSCFGGNLNGALGNRDGLLLCQTVAWECRFAPRAIDAEPTLHFSALAHGVSSSVCAIERAIGAVYCWGENDVAQAGYPTARILGGTDDGGMLDAGAPTQAEAPVHPLLTPTGPLTGVVEVALGSGSGCARDCAGRIYCWGDNTVGQLGQGTADGELHPLALVIP